MTHDKVATTFRLRNAGLSPRSWAICDYWLSLWDGDALPPFSRFQERDIPALAPLTLVARVTPNTSVRVESAGAVIERAANVKLGGADILLLAPPNERGERLRRMTVVARGVVARTFSEHLLRSGGAYLVETVCLPFLPVADGAAMVLTFIEWDPPAKADSMRFSEYPIPLPGLIQWISLDTVDCRPGSPALDDGDPGDTARAKLISRTMMRVLLGVVSDFMAKSADGLLDPVDLVIAYTVGSANTSHIDGDPALSRQWEGMIEPDALRHGISRAAISRATGLPLETTRRRINRLIGLGILSERPDGVFLSANNRHGVGVRMDSMHMHARLAERMFRDLKQRGVLFK